MTPFADDDASVTIDDLVAENGRTVVTLSGEVRLSRDRHGLRLAEELRHLLDAVVTQLERTDDLPERIAGPAPSRDDVANPFA